MSAMTCNFKINKNLVYKSAKDMGFTCILEDGVLMFFPKDETERKKMRLWINENVHFSWGFPVQQRKEL